MAGGVVLFSNNTLGKSQKATPGGRNREEVVDGGGDSDVVESESLGGSKDMKIKALGVRAEDSSVVDGASWWKRSGTRRLGLAQVGPEIRFYNLAQDLGISQILLRNILIVHSEVNLVQDAGLSSDFLGNLRHLRDMSTLLSQFLQKFGLLGASAVFLLLLVGFGISIDNNLGFLA